TFKNEYNSLETAYSKTHVLKNAEVEKLVAAMNTGNETQIDVARTRVQEANSQAEKIRKEATTLLKKNDAAADINDTNYVFLRFVTQYLPTGLVGLLIAIIFLAAMGSTASGLNSLASTTVVDIYKRFINIDASDSRYLSVSRWTTVGWGVFCVVVGLYASRLGNLIEAVNILGSLFYGTILGIFIVAFYMKRIGGTAVFYGALMAEVIIVYLWWFDITSFLWLNPIGVGLVMLFSFLVQMFLKDSDAAANRAADF
ncbi:MAG TPA: sodium:solute symporter, partial [Patescibacteria group bacterium]|nr:sodium:solute symporter [Patescibacteria group bacterium]